jgi:RimJ/RimL family protein N-acetyltransferase
MRLPIRGGRTRIGLVTTSRPATGFSLKPVLPGEKVVLRPYRVQDAPVIAEIIGEPEVRRYTDTRGTFTPDQIRAAIVAHADAADRLDLAVTDAASGELVEGVERETLFADGQWADSVRMAILDWEWTRLAGTR